MTLLTTSRTIRGSVIAGVATSATALLEQSTALLQQYGPRLSTISRSLRTKLVLLALVFAAVPAILYNQFRDAYGENQRLIEQSVQEQGRLITRAITPILAASADQGGIPSAADLSEMLQQLTAGDTAVRILFQPANAASEGFFFVAANPEVSNSYLVRVRDELAGQGVLERLAPTCDGGIDAAIRYPTPGGTHETLTSLTPVNSAAGCWVVITSQASSDLRLSPLGIPYWMRPETRSAAAIYAVMAVVTLSLFASIWRSLRRFGRLAQRIGSAQDVEAASSFTSMNRVPELTNVATEFDRMVEALQNSAVSIRRTAEDNAHAFKTPIAVIRHCLEPLEKAVPGTDNRGRTALNRVTSALDKLDTLVSFARQMDEATALNPPRERLDFSQFFEQVISGYRQVVTQRRIQLDLTLSDGIVIMGNEDMLETVLENLIDNAISFTPDDGWIGAALSVVDGRAQMVIEDSGPGVADTDLERIFNRYFSSREESPETAAFTAHGEHLGIGLWIVRAHITALGGRVHAERGGHGGLRVVASFPRVETRRGTA